MSVGLIELVQSGFNLIVKNKTIFIPSLLALIFSLLLTSSYYTTSPLAPPRTTPLSGLEIIATLVVAVFSWFAYLWAIHLAYSATRKKISLAKSGNVATRYVLRFFVASVLYMLIVFGGLILLIVPGIYLAIRLLFYPYAIVIDNKGVVDSLKRSWKITRRKWWLTFGIGLLIGLLSAVVILPIYFVGLFASGNILVTVILAELLSVIFSTWSLATYSIAYLKLRKGR